MKISWSGETDYFSWRLLGWLYAQVGLWQWKCTYHFGDNSAYFILKIELLLTMFCNFKKETAFKDSAFWQVASLTIKMLWFIYSLIREFRLAWFSICFGIPNNYCVRSNGIGRNRKTDEEHDEDCVEEGFQLPNGKSDKDCERRREALRLG